MYIRPHKNCFAHFMAKISRSHHITIGNIPTVSRIYVEIAYETARAVGKKFAYIAIALANLLTILIPRKMLPQKKSLTFLLVLPLIFRRYNWINERSSVFQFWSSSFHQNAPEKMYFHYSYFSESIDITWNARLHSPSRCFRAKTLIFFLCYLSKSLIISIIMIITIIVNFSLINFTVMWHVWLSVNDITNSATPFRLSEMQKKTNCENIFSRIFWLDNNFRTTLPEFAYFKVGTEREEEKTIEKECWLWILRKLWFNFSNGMTSIYHVEYYVTRAQIILLSKQLSTLLSSTLIGI